MRSSLFPISEGTEPTSPPWPQVRPPTSTPLLVTLRSISQSLYSSLSDALPTSSSPFPAKKRSKEEEDFKRKRRWWAAGVVVAFTTFALWNGMVSLPALGFGSAEEEEWVEVDVDDDDEEEEVVISG
jgi:hypothetical protein